MRISVQILQRERRRDPANPGLEFLCGRYARDEGERSAEPRQPFQAFTPLVRISYLKLSGSSGSRRSPPVSPLTYMR